jgi:hypothetical protein
VRNRQRARDVALELALNRASDSDRLLPSETTGADPRRGSMQTREARQAKFDAIHD